MTLIQLTPRPDWQHQAACRGHDTDWWYPEQGGHRTAATREAKRICRGCPVVAECGQYGIEHEKHGIWGALSERERKAARKLTHQGKAS